MAWSLTNGSSAAWMALPQASAGSDMTNAAGVEEDEDVQSCDLTAGHKV